MRTYTIVAHNETEGQGITECVNADYAYEAVKTFCQDRGFPSDVVIVDVLVGDCPSAMHEFHDGMTTFYCSDCP